MIRKYISVEAKLFKESEKENIKFDTYDRLSEEIRKHNCKCRWCGTKFENITDSEKIKCTNCGWLLWRIDTKVIDYKYKNWKPVFYKSVMLIDLEWDDIKEYYTRSQSFIFWSLFISFWSLESNQLWPYKAIEELEKIEKVGETLQEKYFIY